MPDPLHTPDQHPVYLARQARLRDVMRELDVPVLLMTDPIRIRYACGARNMQIWNSREATRCLLLFADGPAILFEYPGFEHLACGLPTLDDIRATPPIPYVGPGVDTATPARRFAVEVMDLVRQYVASRSARIGIDRLKLPVIDALREAGLELVDAEWVTGVARAVKLDVELPLIRASMRAVEEATAQLEQGIAPGKSENAIWANFHHGLIERDAEYATTRLLVGSDRSYPYFQEASPAPVANNDLLLFDTDAIGIDGYSIDFSRTFVCGDGRVTPEQRSLYQLAYEQLQHNIALFRGGTEFVDICHGAWSVPDAHRESSYYVIAHGIGMSGEYPAIPHLFDDDVAVPVGHLQPGMTVCVESYIGDADSRTGAKLEEHLLITEGAPEILSQYAFEERLL